MKQTISSCTHIIHRHLRIFNIRRNLFHNTIRNTVLEKITVGKTRRKLKKKFSFINYCTYQKTPKNCVNYQPCQYFATFAWTSYPTGKNYTSQAEKKKIYIYIYIYIKHLTAILRKSNEVACCDPPSIIGISTYKHFNTIISLHKKFVKLKASKPAGPFMSVNQLDHIWKNTLPATIRIFKQMIIK